MVALLEDLTLRKYDNVVRIPDSAESVRNDNYGHLRVTAHKSIECLLNLVLTLGVEGRSSFVEEENTGLANQSAGNCNSLLLTTGKLNATLPNKCLVTLREQFDIVEE